MQTSTHYGFNLPGANDFVDIEDLTENWSSVDNILYNSRTKRVVCSTAAATAAKTASTSGGDFEKHTDAQIIVRFTNGNTAANPTLNIDSTGAAPIYMNGAAIDKDFDANGTYLFVFNGTQYDIIGGVGGGGNSSFYGTSSTTSSTAEKAVTVSEKFAYVKGQILSVLFTTANSANAPTLNVNSLGAKSIYNNNAVVSSTNALKWSANKLITFMYDGTYFRVVSIEPSLDGGSWYGTSSTSATTAAKTVTCANFRLIEGAEISVKFSNANTKTDAAITLNVNSTGAKTIYASGAATSSTNHLTWEANAILTFKYDGSYWVCLTETMGVSALGLSVIDGKIAQTITTS